MWRIGTDTEYRFEILFSVGLDLYTVLCVGSGFGRLFGSLLNPYETQYTPYKVIFQYIIYSMIYYSVTG